MAESLVSAITGFLIAFGLVLMYILFMAIDAAQTDKVITRFTPARGSTLGAFIAYARSVRKYYVINTIFGIIVAALDGLLLWALGVPAPLVWAVLAFVTNYIPSIGFIIGLVPPVVLAFIVGGWPTALLVLAAYSVINVVLQVFIQPQFVSQSLRLNLTLTIASVAFWTAVLGPLGAILAIPMTLLVRTILLDSTSEPSPFARWLTGDQVGDTS